MSMSFKNALSDEQCQAMEELFNVKAHDGKEFLLDDSVFDSKKGGDVARMTGQIAELELNNKGDVKELSDGSKYEATEKGWVKIN